jgi:hypothetical protein
MRQKSLLISIVLLALVLAFPLKAQAAMVGRFNIFIIKPGAPGAAAVPPAGLAYGPSAEALPGAPTPLPGTDSMSQGQINMVKNLASGLYIPPSVTPPPPTVYFFNQSFSGNYTLTSNSPFTVGNYSGSGSGSRTGVYPGAFSSTFTLTATSSSTSPTFASFNTGTINLTSSGRVVGPSGGTLTGNMTMTGSTSGGTGFNLTGLVTLQASGNLTFSPSGTFNLSIFTGKVTGSVTQVPR